MTRLIFVFVLCFIFALPLFAQEVTPEAAPLTDPIAVDLNSDATPLAPGTYEVTMTWEERDRRALVTVPSLPNDTPDVQPMPLMLLLHGATGNGTGMRNLTDMDVFAAENGFITVYPDGLGGVWNDGRNDDGVVDARLIPADDVGFLIDLVDRLSERLSVDSERLYSVGYSMGGMMSIRLACDARERFAGIASVASSMPAYLADDCEDNLPTATILIHGTLDQVIPYGGTDFYLSANDSIAYWGAQNGCTNTGTPTLFENTDPQDGTESGTVALEGCDAMTNGGTADVRLIAVQNGGHTYPGHPFAMSGATNRTSLDFDANEAIWEFFRGASGE